MVWDIVIENKTITNIPSFAKKCSLPVLMYPIDEDEPSFDGINLTVGATRTFSVWIICNGFLSFDHSTSHLYLPGNEFKDYFSHKHVFAKIHDITLI